MSMVPVGDSKDCLFRCLAGCPVPVSVDFLMICVLSFYLFLYIFLRITQLKPCFHRCLIYSITLRYLVIVRNTVASSTPN